MKNHVRILITLFPLLSLAATFAFAAPPEHEVPVAPMKESTTIYPAILAFLDCPDWRQPNSPRSEERQQAVDKLTDWISQQIEDKQCVHLMFVCTHNSRRSQFAQVWAATAAAYFGWTPQEIRCFSGGTETTACNPRTISSLKRSGFVLSQTPGDSQAAAPNPKYLVSFSQSEPPAECFSKVVDADINPQTDFIAVMCCDHAAANCPVVKGADARVMMLYDDPKDSDNSPREQDTYDERSKQIAQDMWAVMGAAAARVRGNRSSVHKD